MKKLRIRKDTLRDLSSDRLSAVRGGIDPNLVNGFSAGAGCFGVASMRGSCGGTLGAGKG